MHNLITKSNGIINLPPVTLVVHGSSDLAETSNVRTGNKRRQVALGGSAVLLGGLETVLEACGHDVLQTSVDLLAGPAEAGGVLGHLETRDGDTTGVGGLTGGVPDGIGALVGVAVSFEDVDGLLGATHVRTLGDKLGAGGDESLGLLARDFVLGSGGEGNVDLADVGPGTGAGDVLELLGELVASGDGRELLALDLEVGNQVDLLGGEAALLLGEDERTLGVGERNHGTAKLDDLESGVLSNVTGSGEGNTLVGERLLAARDVLNHVLNVLKISRLVSVATQAWQMKTYVNDTVTSGLGADQRTTPAAALAGENTLPLVANLPVLPEHETDLTAGNTNVTSGNVGVGTNVLGELGHEGNTEAANFVVGLALGVEVGTTLTTTHTQTGESILEDLLESQELEDGEVNSGVETETTLVGTEGRVELHTVATVDLGLVVVVLPDDTELNDTLRDGDDGESLAVLGVLLEEGGVLKSRNKLYRSISIRISR